jgi:serine/threonine protein kinase
VALVPGTHLGRYEIVAPIGAGGMGEVYRARDTQLRRDVAIKVVQEAAGTDAGRLARFEQEALATAALNHPNILAIFDVGMHDGRPFVVSELLEGHTLREILGAGALSARKAVDYAAQIAQGLAAAHEKGIVHRDSAGERARHERRLRQDSDFGPRALRLARCRRQPGDKDQDGVSTVGYMAPEPAANR